MMIVKLKNEQELHDIWMGCWTRMQKLKKELAELEHPKPHRSS